MSFCKGFSQGGSNADVVVADAYIKNLREGIDWITAYEAVVSDAEGMILRSLPKPAQCMYSV